MTLQEEIDYWRKRARTSKTDAWMVAIGIAYGLDRAREEYSKEIVDARKGRLDCLGPHFSDS